MKKLALIAACVVLAGVAVKAEAPPVFSVNGVGYETFTVPGDKVVFLRIDFDKLDGTPWTVYDLFGTNFSHTVAAYYWVNNGWGSENFDGEVWDPGTHKFYRGDVLFVQMEGSASVTNTITIRGEIPGANNGATNDVAPLKSGFNGCGYAYPAAIAITNTTLSSIAGGDIIDIYYWKNNGWGSVGWDGEVWDPANFVMQPGQGYLINKPAAGIVNWTENKPYLWP